MTYIASMLFTFLGHRIERHPDPKRGTFPYAGWGEYFHWY